MLTCDYVEETKKEAAKIGESTPLGAFSKQQSQYAIAFFGMFGHDVYENAYHYHYDWLS